MKGGIEDGYILFIGRIAYQGQIVTGKVVSGSPDYPDTAPMFFIHKEKEQKTTIYELLIYDSSDSSMVV